MGGLTSSQLFYREKISGVRADRPQLATLMAGLKPGDVVLVCKLDWLGRSTREVLDLIERIGRRHVPLARRSALGYLEPAGRVALHAPGRSRNSSVS